MKKLNFPICMIASACLVFTYGCNNKRAENQGSMQDSVEERYAGFGSKEKYGEHLVLIAGCHDCHTPKKMTAQGPEPDFSLALSGHPAQMPVPDINRKENESKGLISTQTLTAWVGPWGVSFAANLTPDATGLGNWEENNFFTVLRKGKHKGVETERSLLPPMPWQMYKNMTDEELSAVFSYLKSIKPVKNIVPPPLAPVTAKR
jgi:hypothetical protein